MERISKYITYQEATRSQKAIEKGIKNVPDVLAEQNMIFVATTVFDVCREYFGGALGVNSFFRNKEVNKLVGGSSTSQHVTGSAIDIEAKKYGTTTNKELFKFIAKNLDFDQLIWEYGDENEPSWIHVSSVKKGNRKMILRAVKVKVVEKGKQVEKTRYIPIDKNFAD